MKSNRMRSITPRVVNRTVGLVLNQCLPEKLLPKPVNLDEIPAPAPISKPQPDKIVQDILLSTLLRVQSSSSSEIAAAAARYIEMIRAEVA
jgi:hypothetical protein